MSALVTAQRTPTLRGALNVGITAAIGAVVANLLVLVGGRLAGADMFIVQAGATEARELGAAIIALMTVLPLAFGTAALALATRWGHRGWTAVGRLGLAIGLLTTVSPFTVEASTATSVTLAVMHAAVGVIWFALVRRGSSTAAG